MEPLGLVVKRGTWYLVAGTEDGQRTFRVDRVTSVDRTGEPVRRPEGFDLEAAWRQVVAVVDDLRAPARVAATADPGIVQVLGWVFDKEVQVGGTRPDGRVDVVVAGNSVEMVARRLAGFGSSVHVLEPPEVRQLLADIGRGLVASYT